MITKVRYDVPIGDLVWEVDIFSGDNEGLILAEVELKHEDQHVELPAWVGAEVTGQAQYYNSSLTIRPFCVWTERDAASSEKALRSS